MSAPKRARHSGSFSPASPPYYQHAKPDASSPSKIAALQPNTPTSPPHMSSNSQSYASSHATDSSGPTASTPISHVPSAASQPTQNDHLDAMMVDDSSRISTVASEKKSPDHTIIHNTDVIMSETEDHRRSDHDRQGEPGSRADAKKAAEDRQEADSDDVFYKLCRTQHAKSRPHPSQNLISLYKLDPLAASVARFDPTTGEKINKLRKSYEGKVKQMGLAGKSRAVHTPGELMQMMSYPDEDWYATHVHSKAIDRPRNNARMARALSMAPGRMPNSVSETYRALVSDDIRNKPATVAMKKPAGTVSGVRSAPSSARPSAAPSPMSRPSRSGKKRSYVDESFVGYEGFGEEATGDDDRGYSKKKRRKVRN
ncbi:Rox3-domain-containing protein [Eremomyces bilateralis CBS 781.70]|uniref:Mediator of RNA polymerase II transcription subunit 19 n=1 Tax=Eremomyces bilateralis CBS 781.70 TaxID=1392243 RepID=A0A6G1GH84_9PEZI|nr:Rox3-domain-containing protein [Eremomyces bilateralis CBS 781.70]KAF1817261.1 Rox3-domain-containing protein [Eremomyces bilateralis CBS 781.70]